jgi:amino acid adenylation domain-containing protein
MSEPQKFSCFMIGIESHLIQCAEILLKRGHKICGIITSEKSIKTWAEEKGIPNLAPGPDLAMTLDRQPFDYLFSITHLSIIPAEILALPRKGAVNFHNGPLPKYAGLNVTSWALLNQEKVHGITWHFMSVGVDEGDILKQPTIEIAEGDTALTLNVKCYEACIDSFGELVDELASRRIKSRKQNLSERTYFSKYKRPLAACTISWSEPAEKIAALVRALDFGPYSNPLGLPKIVIGNDVFFAPEIDVLGRCSQAAAGTITAIDDDSMGVATANTEIALRKLVTITGQTFSIPAIVAKYGLRKGHSLSELDQETANRLTTLNDEICRHEEYWVSELTKWEPIEIPYGNHSQARTRPSQYITVPMPIPGELNTFFTGYDDVGNQVDFLTAIFAAYLARISGKYIFDIGFSYSGLRQKVGGFEHFFATHVPLQVELGPSTEFGPFLDMVRTRLALIKKHKTYAHDVMLRYPELGLLRAHGDRSPLPIVVEQLKCLEDHIPMPGSELTLLLSEDGTECRWVFDGALLDRENICSMQRQFVTYLRNVIANKNHPIIGISPMTEAEHHQLIIGWNNTQVDYPKHQCIHELFEAQAILTPDTVAVVFEDKQLTYQQLNGRANQLAHHLRKLKVGPQAHVGIYIERSLDTVVGILGILKAGGAYVPLDPTYPKERLVFMLNDAQVPVLLTRERLIENLPECRTHVVCLDRDWEAIARENEEDPVSGVKADDPVYVIYTSGSTGAPKGVVGLHRGAVNRFNWMWRTYPFEEGEVCCQKTSLSFVDSVWEIFGPLLQGIQTVIIPDETLKDPHALIQTLAAKRVSRIVLVPSLLRIILDACNDPQSRLPNLKIWVSSGEALSKELAERFRKNMPQAKLINLYGSSEVSGDSTCYETSDGKPLTSVPIGRPIDNTQIYLLDRHLQPVPIGVPGELHIGGDGLAQGYFNRPELTAEKFIRNPFVPGGRLYKTGDLARYLPDGNIEFIGRIDHQVKIRGFRIELGEIEAVLRQHPGVREGVVDARKDVAGDKRLVAYIVPSEGQTDLVSTLRAYLMERLPDYMVPSVFVMLDALPRMPNGKVNRQGLPAPESVLSELESAYVAPQTEIERIITAIWQEVLHINKIGVNDNFFDLGGHSLRMMQAHIKLRERLQRDFSILEMFKYPTISSLAHHLSQEKGEQSSFRETDARAEKLQEGKNRLKQRLRQRQQASEA